MFHSMFHSRYSLIIFLLLAVVAGTICGSILGETSMMVLLTFKHIIGQFIFFCVPLIIIGFIAPAITSLQEQAGKLLTAALLLAYASSVGAALFSMLAGYAIIPHLSVNQDAAILPELPSLLFKLDIPPLMSTMSALIFALLLGMTAIWQKAQLTTQLLEEFNGMIMFVVNRLIIPVLPVFVFTTFAGLGHQGLVTQQLPMFIAIVLIVIVGHFIWLAVLYSLGGLISRKNPWQVIRHYLPAYLTAVGTMSSAATLPVALSCARQSPLPRRIVDFSIPLGATIHLCGSVLTETFFVMSISLLLYGGLPDIGTMMLFIILLGVFAVGAPGVPGGTVMASLGLIISVLGFDDTGIALMLTIFALQDSFGTACNVTGDGALAMMLDGLFPESQEEKLQSS